MNKKPLYIWWLTTLSVLSAFFWGLYTGLVQKIFHEDVTMITSINGTLLVVFLGIIGYIAYNKDKNTNKLQEYTWFVSEQVLALGMLGTVLGFVYVLSSGLDGVTVADPSALSNMLGNMSVGLGIALYTNAVGIIASLILKNLLYVVTFDETHKT